ncbi:hypothetical protein CPB85DRAFT_1253594 [Mucidula mucida]|nr:hypothetical protein CPB85DRAFT_1253594 [Mucidula mucida]
MVDLQSVKDGKSSLHDEQRLLADVQARLALYKEQQAAALLLPQKIRDAAIEEEYLLRCIRNRAILRGPMRTIPTEILSAIFVYHVSGCIPEDVRVDRDADFLADCRVIERAPKISFSLSAADGMPRRLLSRDFVPRLVVNDGTVKHRLASDDVQTRAFYWQHFHKRIARSGALPIGMVLFEYDSANHVSDAESSSLYDAMLNLVPRARKVQFFIECQHSDDAVQIPSWLDGDDARLEGIEVAILSVHGYGQSRTLAMELGAQLLRRIIHIRHLTLSDSTNTQCLWHGALTNLTDLTLGALNASLFFAILERASSLRNVRVRKIVPDIIPSSSSPFTHRELHRLDIQCCPYPYYTPNETWEVLRGLTLPNLHILHLAPHIGHAWPSQEVVDFFVRSKCHLSELCIRDVPTSLVGEKISEISESLKSLVLFNKADINDMALVSLSKVGLLRNLQRLTMAVRGGQIKGGKGLTLWRAYEMEFNRGNGRVDYEVYIDAEKEGGVGRYVKAVVRPFADDRYAIDLGVTYY